MSVVLCTYAEEMYEHFSEAADSVLSQTYGSVELVVIVDGKKSVYDRAVADYGTRDDVVIQYNEVNVGLLESRNRGADVANGDVVAFIDDDAVADERWIEKLVRAYKDEEAIAVGGKMTPMWIAGKPSFLPDEFYWLVGVTHRGFADGPGEVRNTFGSNISFRMSIFKELNGFDVSIGGRKGGSNLQGGETELCARMYQEYGRGVWYDPEAVVAHKVFDYRTDVFWLLDRAFWQGYSKKVMETLINDSRRKENEFLKYLLTDATTRRLKSLIKRSSRSEFKQFTVLYILIILVGAGYIYASLSYST